MNFTFKYNTRQAMGLIITVLSFFLYGAGCSKSGGNTPPPTVVTAHTYYVSNQGSDANAGTLQAPIKSIGIALDKAVAGDIIIVRGGTYFEKLSFSKSGVLASPVTVKAYPGERPVLDGSNLTVTGWTSLLSFSNARYIVLDGFDICNVTSAASNADPEGIFINGTSHDITIKNCRIYNIKNSATLANGRSGHAILVIGSAATAITNLVIDSCTIHDTWTGTSENLTVAGNVDGFTISHNTIYNTENIGIIVAGGDGLNPSGNVATNYARNGVVSDNVLYNVSMANSAVVWGTGNYGAIAIYVCGGAGAIIERNKVYNCDRGIGLVSESNIYPTKTTIVRNNFVYNCWRTGIYMGDYLNYTHGGTNNCYVVNNTLYQNDRTTGAFGEIEGEIRLTEHCDSNVICNNIIYAEPTDVYIHKYTNTGSNNIIDNNLYYTTGTPQWIWNSMNGAPVTDFDTWKATAGIDANSASGINPLLLNITGPDLHIQPSSPATTTGVIISPAIHGSTDIDGNARIVNGKISKGAQQ